MASHVEKAEKNVVRIHLDFTQDEFKSGLASVYKKTAKRFSIPGFRPGKAPMAVAMRYYGEGVLYEDAVNSLVEEAYPQAVKEHELQPVGSPKLDIEEIGPEKGLKVVLDVTVKPEVQLGQYKGVEAVRHDAEIKESDVAQEIERIQNRNARMVPVEDRPIADGDTANINYEGSVDGVPFAGGKGENYDLHIGSHSFIPGFEDQLIGVNNGADCEVHVTFPEDYQSEELKGKAAVFKVHVNSIHAKELPELDDEFAKDISEFDTFEEYRASIRKDLEEHAQKMSADEFENNAVEAAVSNAAIDIPEVMIENEMDDILGQQTRQMSSSGFSLDDYLGYIGKSKEEFRESLREGAIKRVKASLVLEAIANAEAIEVSDEEMREEINKTAAGFQMSPEDLESRLSTEGRSFFCGRIKEQKAVDLIREQALPIAPPAIVEVNQPAETAAAEDSAASADDSAENSSS